MAVGDITILDAVPIRLTMRPDIDHDSNYLLVLSKQYSLRTINF